MDRLTPVTLIVGAASRFGAARARELAQRSQGGLLLAACDQDALSAIADDLDMQNLSPERVSTLAFDPSDEARWKQAGDFIAAQYGRLDYAIVVAAPPPLAPGDLVQFGAEKADFSALQTSLRAIAAVMRKGVQGGVIVVGAENSAIAGHEPAFAAVVQGAAQRTVRVNALIVGGAGAPAWRGAPALDDLLGEAGDLRGALGQLARSKSPAAYCSPQTSTAKLTAALFSDDCPLSGAVLIVDGEHAM